MALLLQLELVADTDILCFCKAVSSMFPLNSQHLGSKYNERYCNADDKRIDD